MSEVPEHLLQRSRERREALGLGGGGGGESSGSAAPATTGAAPAPAAAVAGDVEAAPVPAAPVVFEAPPPPRPRPSATRVPVWVIPVLAALPLWGFFYLGAFGSRATASAGPNGAQIFATNCATCHGAAGEGGVGPALKGGQAKLTFPNEADHIAWVHTGSGPYAGKPYGARGHVAKGGMPPFAGTLTDAQIQAVVTYERDQL